MGSRSASPDRRTDACTPSVPGIGERPEASQPPGEGLVLVALVTRPHGVRGEVKIEIHSDVEGRFDPGRELVLRVAGQAPRTVRVGGFRPARGGGILRLDGWQDRDQAEALRGARLEVPLAQVPAPPAGLYYHFELVGCRCLDADQGDLGEVTAVTEDGGGVLLEVAGSGQTLPIPFVEAFLESVDVAGKEIRLRLPPGLVEICASRS